MAIDLVLWLIFAAVIGLVVCGCIYTAPAKRLKGRAEAVEDQPLDRAA